MLPAASRQYDLKAICIEQTHAFAGHHATERYGAPAVAAQVAEAHGISHVFIDIDNPA